MSEERVSYIRSREKGAGNKRRESDVSLLLNDEDNERGIQYIQANLGWY